MKRTTPNTRGLLKAFLKTSKMEQKGAMDTKLFLAERTAHKDI